MSGLLLLSASGCSSVRLAYGNASQLTWWWLDGYVDFDRSQAPQVRRAIDSFYDWHRATQLPIYVSLLDELQAVVMAPTTPADICRLQDRVEPLLRPSVNRALQLLAEHLPPLSDEQLAHIRKRYDKNNVKARDDHLQPDPKRRLQASTERTIDHAEKLYGPLEPLQRAVIRDGLAQSPYQAERALQDRKYRQERTLAALRRMQAEGASDGQRLSMLQALIADLENAAGPGDSTYQARLREYNCSFAARLHNSTTAAQRGHARDTLKGWQDDLRSLAPPT